MQVTYPSHHRWLKDISAGFEIDFSGRAAKKIHAALPQLEGFNISYTIEPLNEAFLEDFIPKYEADIGSKQNALLHDVKGKTYNNEKSIFPYFCLSLKEHGVFIGGTIFSVRTDRVSYAYRTFNNNWIDAPVKASPALIGEYAVAQFACAQGLKYLSHGKDRNPYGLNASIGLATFKLSVGCRPYIGSDESDVIKTIDTKDLKEDCLILEMPKEGTAITKAYLVTTKETLEKYIQVTKYPELLAVEVLYRT